VIEADSLFRFLLLLLLCGFPTKCKVQQQFLLIQLCTHLHIQMFDARKIRSVRDTIKFHFSGLFRRLENKRIRRKMALRLAESRDHRTGALRKLKMSQNCIECY
jgi:hypothetical protein